MQHIPIEETRRMWQDAFASEENILQLTQGTFDMV